MVVTVTGSSTGYTQAQGDTLKDLLASVTLVRHGLCVGGDELAQLIANDLGIPVVAHPGVDKNGKPRKRSKYQDCLELFQEILPPEHFLARNLTMVALSDEVIGLVSREQTTYYRSGEWHTINTGLKSGKPVTLIMPSGIAVVM